ncbi:hypothetical protein DUNSADRAFT_14077 [Dunaliella salina]|uniref:Uncharacterized protein n=1 Tax=Dunaliella salina TaxID=3046 RepID=A0ABQ7G825_DUNSA|nr:hypothetical protein DUNSADRAFT_14077 [Dunaliella salina]|eukprot:KAF5830757.1 hypothetical protein DUNSADRAFT_14077 [Dunaliella salina]
MLQHAYQVVLKPFLNNSGPVLYERFQAEVGTLPEEASDIENLEKAFTTVTTILQGGRQSVKGKTLMPKPRIFLFTNEEVPKVATDPGYK